MITQPFVDLVNIGFDSILLIGIGLALRSHFLRLKELEYEIKNHVTKEEVIQIIKETLEGDLKMICYKVDELSAKINLITQIKLKD